ncbi:MAG: hypothetical protein ABW133_16220 [Polyangiaceae bacterium]
MKCFIPVGLLAATLLLGCSDEREPVPPAGDAGVTSDVVAEEGSAPPADVSVDIPRGDGYIDLFDVFPLPDAGCTNCIRDRCGSQINACFNNPACGQGLLCTLQNCAALDGGISTTNPAALICVLNCFNGDQATAFMAIGSLTCLTMTCGSVCIPEAGPGFDVRPPNPDANDVSADRATPDGESDATTPDATDHDVSAPDAEPDTHDHDVNTPDASAPDGSDDVHHDDADGGTTSDGGADAPETTSDDAGSDANSDGATPDDAGTD